MPASPNRSLLGILRAIREHFISGICSQPPVESHGWRAAGLRIQRVLTTEPFSRIV